MGEEQKERGIEDPKVSALTAGSPMWGSNSQTLEIMTSAKVKRSTD